MKTYFIQLKNQPFIIYKISLPEQTDDRYKEKSSVSIRYSGEWTELSGYKNIHLTGKYLPIGRRLEGEELERALKYADKITAQSDRKKFMYEAAVKNIEDGLSYTFVCDNDSLTEAYNNTVNQMTAANYILHCVINTWLDPLIGLNAVICYFMTPKGQLVEVWFHTKETKKVYDDYHKYYEVLKTTDDEKVKEACDKILHKAYYSCKVPRNIKKIENYRNAD